MRDVYWGRRKAKATMAMKQRGPKRRQDKFIT